MTAKTCNNVPYASTHFGFFYCHLSHSHLRQPKPQSDLQDALHSPHLVSKPSLGISPVSSKYWSGRGPAFPPLFFNVLSDSEPSFSANLIHQIRLAELRRATPPGLHSTPGYRPSVCCHLSLLPKLQSLAGKRRYQPHRPPLVPVYN
jgi:hypothetical protein